MTQAITLVLLGLAIGHQTLATATTDHHKQIRYNTIATIVWFILCTTTIATGGLTIYATLCLCLAVLCLTTSLETRAHHTAEQALHDQQQALHDHHHNQQLDLTDKLAAEHDLPPTPRINRENQP